MSCGLVRLRCERHYGVTVRQVMAPDYRQFDVPPGRIEEQIRLWYEQAGWTVEREEL
jgi:hypothetical protein